MGYYVPDARIFNSLFASQVLRGEKLLLKKDNVKNVGSLYNYKDCSKQALYTTFPNRATLQQYLPDNVPISQVSKLYLYNVI